MNLDDVPRSPIVELIRRMEPEFQIVVLVWDAELGRKVGQCTRCLAVVEMYAQHVCEETEG